MVVQPYHGRALAPLADCLAAYRQAFPEAKLMAPEFYAQHPALEAGQHLLAALDPTGRVLGIMPLFAAPADPNSPPSEPHHIWTILLARPDLAPADAAAVRAALWQAGRAHAVARQAPFDPRRRTRLAADLMASQTPDIDFLCAQGFAPYDGVDVMQRAGAEPAPPAVLPPALTLRRGRLAGLAEQQAYLAACNLCFVDLPRTLADLQFLLASPQWSRGAAFGAYDTDGRLVGSVLAYSGGPPDEAILDDVFVVPAWRRQRLGQALVAAALRWLAEQGTATVRLEVKRSNTPAVRLYQSMGFSVVQEEVLLGQWLPPVAEATAPG